MKGKSIKALEIIGFAVSGIISFLLACTLCDTIFEYILAGFMTLVMQASGFYFMKKTLKESITTLKLFWGMLAFTLFFISIVGTLSYQFGQQNEVKNDNIVNSDIYNTSKENRNINKQLLADARQESIDLKSNYKIQIDSLIKEKNSLPKNYITMKSKLQNEINAKQKELIDLLRANGYTVTQLTQKLTTQSAITQADVEILETKGYLPLVATLNKWFDIDTEILTLLIQSFIAIIFEITAIGLHVSGELSRIPCKSEKPLHATVTQESKPITQFKKADLKIVKCSPQPEKKKEFSIYDNPDAKKYIDTMYENSKNGFAKGYKTISKIAQVPPESVGRKVMNYLETTGVIDDKRKILKNREYLKV